MAEKALNNAIMAVRVSRGWIAVVVILLAACSSAPNQHQPVAAVKLQPSKAQLQLQSQERQRSWVALMLMDANQAFDRNRLMKPKSDNAYDRYRQILDIEPNNLAAKAGIKHISRRYLTLAKEAFDRGNVRVAQDYLYQSQKIAPNYSGAQAMASYFKQYRPAAITPASGGDKTAVPTPLPAAETDHQYNEYLLNSRDLMAKNAIAEARLAEISQLASQWQSRLLIVARNDAQGRWIYQQLKQKAAGYRFRANIEVGKLPRVVLLDQPLVSRAATATTAIEE